MPQQRRSAAADAFVHPQAGRCRRERTLLAIRWRTEASEEAKGELLGELGLVLATLEGEEGRPGVAVNQTDALSWVQLGERKNVSAAVEKRLEQSDLVEWVGRAFRGERGEQGEAGLFTVNPARLYVTEDALGVAEEAGLLGEDVAPDAGRPTLIPGLVALRIQNPSATEGRAAIEIGTQIAAERAGAVRFENIPFLSPSCHVREEACAPPTSEFVPNDPEFVNQWGMRRIGAPRGWEIARGDADVVVAVLDQGVELGHPDLSLFPQSWNTSTDTPDGSPTGDHGTACAGIVAARLDNGLGVAGVAGGARVMAIATATWADVDIAEGLHFAADNGARVISMSFGVYPSWGVWDFDLIRDALQYAHDRGLLLVAASGNEDIDESRFPGSDPRTVCVGGSNRDDQRKRTGDASSESWWGACYGDDLDVVAPCLEIPTTDRLGSAGYGPEDFIEGFNGTSAATPHVAGMAALLLSQRPSLTNVQLRGLIESTCDKISPDLYAYASVASKPSGSWHREVGYGRINVERAMLAACALGGERDGSCSGCGGECLEDTPAECVSPEPIPWLAYDRVMYFYESRIVADPRSERLQLRFTYEHSLRLLGRQQGPLVYTLSLLPSEEATIYEYDRFRRVREDSERVSVQSSFRQTVSALNQARTAQSLSTYAESLVEARSRADSSVSVGGGLLGFLGFPSGGEKGSVEGSASSAAGFAASAASERFAQSAIVASQSVEAERSIVVSRFEDSEHREVTSRRLRNDNRCYAVNYMVRRVNEVYEASSRLVAVEWRRGESSPWQPFDGSSETREAAKEMGSLARTLPRVGERASDPRTITLPTDGTLYEPELAHCSSCEPAGAAEELAELELTRIESRKRCLEAELLELELERRRSLAAQGTAEPLQLGPWTLESYRPPGAEEAEPV
jgi:Subtilase family